MSTTNTVTNKTTIKPSQLPSILALCHKANLVPIVLSSPGIGKSSLAKQYADSIGYNFIDTRLAYSAPTDIKGFPMINRETNKMEFAIPAEYPTTPRNVWCLDEFPCAGKQVQNGSLQLTLDKRVGDYVVPDDTLIMLAGNSQADRVHVEKLSSAVCNRLMFVYLAPDLDDWSNWALENGIDVRMVAFLRFRPDLLHNFDAKKWDGESGFASPRSWASAARLIEQEPPASLRLAMLEGLLGAGAAAELNGFLSIYEALPSIDGVLLDPKGSPVPKDPSARYAVCAALANRATKGNFGRIAQYVSRLPKEFEVFGVRLVYKMKKEVASTTEFISWATDNREVLL